MKILLANKFHYRRGGDCIYTLNLGDMLRAAGHEVLHFTMEYPDNLSDPPAATAPQVSFSGNIVEIWHGAMRACGFDGLGRQFGDLLAQTMPDVVHLNNIHSYLSPVLAQEAHRRGIKVVWTLHDYKLICPSYSCLSHGLPCTRCIGRSKAPLLITRCMKHSFGASALAWLEAMRWRRKTIEPLIDTFICPSQFMADMMERGGYPASRLRVLNNFTDTSALPEVIDAPHRDPYYCYVGRLSEEKGVRTLIKAAKNCGHQLRIAGDGPLARELHKDSEGYTHIKWLGQLDPASVTGLLAKASFTVIPSECYDNNPLSLIESLCMGTPVIGTDMGGIPELIDDTNGLIYKSSDTNGLISLLPAAIYGPWDHNAIAREARLRFDSSRYIDTLVSIYKG